MATPGVKLNLTKDAIVSSLKEAKGIISQAAKKLDIAGYTLRKKIKEYPDVQELLAALRHDYENAIIDMAEHCVAVAMYRQAEDPCNALKAGIFTLNSRGKSRGWNNTFLDNSASVSQVDIENQKMVIQAQQKELDELRKQRQAE